MFADYINRNICRCVGVDISQGMIDIAENKFSEYENIELLCADAETFEFNDKFDCIVIYNAFPHFANRSLLFKNLSECLKSDGRITIAHSMSREDLIKHHSGRAERVSTILPETDEMKKIMEPYFIVDTQISTDQIYIVSGKKV